MQLHLGALRNNNTRLMNQIGADTGFDSVGDFSQARTLAAFLDRLDSENALPRTILYNLNPADNYAFATMLAISRTAPSLGRSSSAAAGGFWIRRKAWNGR